MSRMLSPLCPAVQAAGARQGVGVPEAAAGGRQERHQQAAPAGGATQADAPGAGGTVREGSRYFGICLCAVWYGMVWRGMVWYGNVWWWCGMAWYGMVWWWWWCVCN